MVRKGFIKPIMLDYALWFIATDENGLTVTDEQGKSAQYTKKNSNQAQLTEITKFLSGVCRQLTLGKASSISRRSVYKILKNLIEWKLVENLQSGKGIYTVTSSGKLRAQMLNILFTSRKWADLNMLPENVGAYFTRSKEGELKSVDLFVRITDSKLLASLSALRDSYKENNKELAAYLGKIIHASLALACELPHRTDLAEMFRNPDVFKVATRILRDSQLNNVADTC